MQWYTLIKYSGFRRYHLFISCLAHSTGTPAYFHNKSTIQRLRRSLITILPLFNWWKHWLWLSYWAAPTKAGNILAPGVDACFRNALWMHNIPVSSSHRNYELPLLEIFHKRNGILFEVGQAAIDGLWVIIWSSLLFGSLVQPFLQVVVCAG